MGTVVKQCHPNILSEGTLPGDPHFGGSLVKSTPQVKCLHGHRDVPTQITPSHPPDHAPGPGVLEFPLQTALSTFPDTMWSSSLSFEKIKD